MTKKELVQIIKDNFTNEDGEVNIYGMDFGNCDVNIGGLKTNGYLYQDYQKVGKTLYQDHQEVGRILFQSNQKVGGNLYQYSQKVKGSIWQYNHNAKEIIN